MKKKIIGILSVIIVLEIIILIYAVLNRDNIPLGLYKGNDITIEIWKNAMPGIDPTGKVTSGSSKTGMITIEVSNKNWELQEVKYKNNTNHFFGGN